MGPISYVVVVQVNFHMPINFKDFKTFTVNIMNSTFLVTAYFRHFTAVYTLIMLANVNISNVATKRD